MAEEQAKQEQENDNSRLGDVIKVVLLAWAMAILTANYLGYVKAMDPTFPASLLTGTMTSFGVNIKRANGKKKEEPTLKEETPTSKSK